MINCQDTEKLIAAPCNVDLQMEDDKTALLQATQRGGQKAESPR
jgi:hypothetical protein